MYPLFQCTRLEQHHSRGRWSLLVVLLFALTLREAWHACFDAHDEIAHSDGATYSEHCGSAMLLAPLAAEASEAPPEQVLPNVRAAERGSVLMVRTTSVQECPIDRGPPALV
ncbi:MAG: hypothetical protein R2818_15560 [Flavobacteriales bacterium]